jgi:putative acetyltransferase
MEFTLRHATFEDCDAIAEAHMDSIRTLGPQKYSPAIVASWATPRNGARYRAAMEGGEIFFIALDAEKTVLGFSSYRFENDKHRVAIYIRGRAARMGVGTALIKRAEEAAQNAGAKEIHVNSSLVAVPFYASQGFEVLSEGKHNLRSGLPMACVFMKKTL